MEKDNKYLRAKQRIEEVKKFYNHVFSTIFVIVLTGGINYYVDKWEHPWFLWVVCGTGIGLVFHASKTFGLNLFFGQGLGGTQDQRIYGRGGTSKEMGIGK